MDQELRDAREDYQLDSLSEKQAPERPLELFSNWLNEYKSLGNRDHNAMLLTTVKENNSPASRIVLLKGLSKGGMEFYSNYQSNKGIEMSKNPNVALTFFWPQLEKQIRVEGRVEKLSPEESDAYFRVRPRTSQIGAWVSPQSNTIDNREFLEERVVFFEKKFEGQEVPRPPHWGGYRVNPNFYEFWQGRSSRLHDRLIYQKQGSDWMKSRLAP